MATTSTPAPAGNAANAPATSHQPIGHVAILHGTATAIAPNGSERHLEPNSPVFAEERIVTGGDGSVSIVFDDPAHTQLDLGRMSEVTLDEDVFTGGEAPIDAGDVATDVDQIQQALLAGDFDPTINLEAPAAGAGGPASAGGGHPVPLFDFVNPDVTPDSGAPTTGIASDFLDPVAGIEGEAPAVVAPALPTISINDVTVHEPDMSFDYSTEGDGYYAQTSSPTTLATFTVSLSAPSDVDVTVAFQTADGTAIVGVEGDPNADYHENHGTLTIPAGDTSITVDVEVTGTPLDDLGHQVYEGPENFFVNLSDPVNATIADGQGVGTIVDDPPAFSVQFLSEGAGVIEGDGAQFVISLSNASTEPITLDLNTVPGTATADADYNADNTQIQYQVFNPATLSYEWVDTDGQVTFSPGDTQITVRVATIDDTVYEPGANETLDLQATVADGTTSNSSAAATGAIIDNDNEVQLSVVNGEVEEGNQATFAVTLAEPSHGGTTVTVNVFSGSADSATEGADYDAHAYDVHIPDGQTYVEFTVDTYTDEIDEHTETFSAQIVATDSATGTVNFDNSVVAASILDTNVPQVSLIGGDEVPEGDDAQFTVHFDINPVDPVNVTIALGAQGDSATFGDDYEGAEVYDSQGDLLTTVTNGSFTLNGLTGDTDFYVHANGDSIDEHTENFTATITDASGETTIGTASAQAAILDTNVPQVSLIGGDEVPEGDDAQFTVHFDINPVDPVNVTIALGAQGDSATFGDDYEGAEVYDSQGDLLTTVTNGSFTLNGLTGDTDFYVHANGDSIDEHTENFTATITDASGETTIGTASAQAAILDTNVPQVSLIGGDEVPEGDDAQFTVHFDINPVDPVNVTIALGAQGDSATFGDDYEGAEVYDSQGDLLTTVTNGSFTLNGLTGDTDFYVHANGDSIDEHTENFTATITDASGETTIGTASAQAAILDTNVPQVSLIGGDEVPEGDDAQFTVHFDINPVDPVNVTIALGAQGDSATFGDDYEGAEVYDSQGDLLTTVTNGSFTLNGLTGDTDFYVHANGDSIDEHTENFTATITDASGETTIGTASAQAAILDTNVPQVSLIGGDEVPEGDDAQFTVHFDINPVDPVNVTIALGAQGDSATFGDDYEGAEVYDSQGDLLTTVTNGSFTLNGLTGDTDFYVHANGDSIDEHTENFTATITDASGETTIGTASAQAAILDTNVPQVSLIGGDEVPEGDDAQFTVHFDINPVDPVNVTIALGAQGDSATFGDDYEGAEVYDSQGDLLTTVTNGSFTLNGLTGDTDFYVHAIDDSVAGEPDEIFTATITDASGETTIGTAAAQATIIDNDEPVFPSGMAYTILGGENAGDSHSILYGIDLETGAKNLVGTVEVTVPGKNGSTTYDNLFASSLTLNPEDGYLYGLASHGNVAGLIKVNTATAQAEFVGGLHTEYGLSTSGMAFTTDGHLYAAIKAGGNSWQIVEIDTTTGNYTTTGTIIDGAVEAMAVAEDSDGYASTVYYTIGSSLYAAEYGIDNTGQSAIGQIYGSSTIEGLSFDDHGNLWGADNQGAIYSIDPVTAAGTYVATIANFNVSGSGLGSLAISIVDPGTYVVLSEGGEDSTHYYPVDANETVVVWNDTSVDVSIHDINNDGVNEVNISQSGSNHVDGVFVKVDSAADVTVTDFDHVDVDLRDGDPSHVTIEDATSGTVHTGEGNDQIDTSSLSGTAAITIETDGGNDTILAGAGHETIDGGEGNDTVSYAHDTAGVTVDLSGTANAEGYIATSGGDATGDFLANVENVIGGSGEDHLTGDDHVNILVGGGGVDTLHGGGEADTFAYQNTTDGGNVAGGDHITDFNTAEGDTLNLHDVLTGYTSGADLANFVKLTDSTDGTVVSVNPDGDGNDANFTDIATLDDVHGQDASVMDHIDLSPLLDDGTP